MLSVSSVGIVGPVRLNDTTLNETLEQVSSCGKTARTKRGSLFPE